MRNIFVECNELVKKIFWCKTKLKWETFCPKYPTLTTAIDNTRKNLEKYKYLAVTYVVLFIYSYSFELVRPSRKKNICILNLHQTHNTNKGKNCNIMITISLTL